MWRARCGCFAGPPGMPEPDLNADDHYAVLGVSQGASPEVIKGAYRIDESGKPPFEVLNVFASEKGMLCHWRFVVSGLLDGSSTHKYPGGVEVPFASIFAAKDETTGEYVGGVNSAFVYDPEEHVPKLQQGDKNRSWVFTKDHIVARVPLSSFLTEEYISQMPTASQQVVRAIMRPDAGPRRRVLRAPPAGADAPCSDPSEAEADILAHKIVECNQAVAKMISTAM